MSIQFKPIQEEHLELILEWRTLEHVTKYMYTDIEFNIKKQKEWYQSTLNDPNNFYWVIYFRDTPIGLISINKLEKTNKHCTFGYYLGDLNYSIVAGRIHPYLYNFIFKSLNLNKAYAEVMEGNESMMKMHKHYGFREVGIYRNHIYKYNRFHDIYLFELLSDTWNIQMKKYHKLEAEFVMSLS